MLDVKMVREINGLGSQITNSPRSERSAEKKDDKAAASPESGQTAARDEVELSNQAQGLQALTDKVAELPDVNVEKVASIKAALERNEFNIDELVLADKILNNDALFDS